MCALRWKSNRASSGQSGDADLRRDLFGIQTPLLTYSPRNVPADFRAMAYHSGTTFRMAFARPSNPPFTDFAPSGRSDRFEAAGWSTGTDAAAHKGT